MPNFGFYHDKEGDAAAHTDKLIFGKNIVVGKNIIKWNLAHTGAEVRSLATMALAGDREGLIEESEKGKSSSIWSFSQMLVHESIHHRFEAPGDHTHHTEEAIEGFEEKMALSFGNRMRQFGFEAILFGMLENNLDPSDLFLNPSMEHFKGYEHVSEEDGNLAASSPVEKAEAIISEQEKEQDAKTGVGRAFEGDKDVGGIDFNPAHLELEIMRDTHGIPLPVGVQPIEDININGLVPIIINIVPLHTLPLLLNMDFEEEAEFKLSSVPKEFNAVAVTTGSHFAVSRPLLIR